MKTLAALILSLAMAAPAAPSLAQAWHGHGGQRGGPEAGRGRPGGGPGGGPGAEGPGGYGGPRGGYPDARGGYAAPRGGYPDPRGPYPDPRGGYGYPAPYGERRGPDSLGADWGGQQDEVRAGVRQGRYIGLGRVIGSIRQRTPGHQLDAGLEQWGGRAVYRVRWAEPGGRRVDYIVDAQSGAILSVGR
jgi:Peptidase propeptide and YPEB domain